MEIVGTDRVRHGEVERGALLCAPPGNIKEDGAAYDAAPCPVVDAMFLNGDAVVELFVGRAVVAEAVPLGGGLGVEVVEDVVFGGDGEAAHGTVFDLVFQRGTIEQRRVGKGAIPVERKDGAALDALCRAQGAFRREQVQAAECVARAPETPGGTRGGAGRDGEFVIGRQTVVLRTHGRSPFPCAASAISVCCVGDPLPGSEYATRPKATSTRRYHADSDIPKSLT